MQQMSSRSLIRAAAFLGAGASCFAKFPSVDSFFKHIWPQREGRAYEVCSQLARMISLCEQTKDNMEWPVFNAEKLFTVLENLVKTEKILNIDGKPQPITISNGRGIEMSATDLMTQLRAEVVRTYGTELDTHILSTAPHNGLFKLLDTVLPESESIHVFTTNYDRLLEGLFEFWDNGSSSTYATVSCEP
jgi:hypothetical protein